ncbi:hypothetical protein [Streptococcus cuniculipharyngis]|uniref:hypothetical protein n=1 Tax=Streptococcus cuniculipharyngis TaxID=1562651 RepID=UPI0016463764|nr:hypothetical protein [Streptococcus cuniculipharyngis]
MMKKLFAWLFAKPKKIERFEEVVPRPTWEENARRYDAFHAGMRFRLDGKYGDD